MDSAIVSEKWHSRIIRSGYLVGAILLHLILFLLVATFVVFRAPVKDDDTKFIQVSIKPPPPPPAPPAAAGGQTMSNLEPSVETVAPPTAPSIVSTTSPSDFSVKSVKVSIPNMPASMSTPEGTGLSGQGAPGPSLGSGSSSSPFGSESSVGAVQLQGYLYDLKQTADKKPTNMIPGNYHRKLAEFVAANWNPSVLGTFYKSPTALNTSSIFIPTLSAMDGPKAFHVDGEVQPNMYVIWYKTKAAPSQDGTFHFVGVADDILLVRVDGKTVLDGSLFPVDTKLQAQEKKYETVNFRASCPADHDLRVGTPFHASAGQAIDIDVMIGEEPGGYSNYFLYIQREESTYQNQSNSTPLLPVFQLDSNSIHPVGKPLSWPPFSNDAESWGAGK